VAGARYVLFGWPSGPTATGDGGRRPRPRGGPAGPRSGSSRSGRLADDDERADSELKLLVGELCSYLIQLRQQTVKVISFNSKLLLHCR
jgi:hypothetical protein